MHRPDDLHVAAVPGVNLRETRMAVLNLIIVTGGAVESNYERAERLTAEALVKDARIVGLMTEVDNLHVAVGSRATIEQAKGVIMHTLGCGAEAAFGVLVARSQSENRKLHDIAEEIAAAQD